MCVNFLSILLAYLLGYCLTLFNVIVVYFSTYHELDTLRISILGDLTMPVGQPIEALIVRDRVYQQNDGRLLVVQLVNGAVLFWSGRVPQLQLDSSRGQSVRVNLECFRVEGRRQGYCTVRRKFVVNVPLDYACLSDRTITDKAYFKRDCFLWVTWTELRTTCQRIQVLLIKSFTVATCHFSPLLSPLLARLLMCSLKALNK